MLKHRWIIAILAMSLAVAVLLSPHASQAPDGLERVAQDSGFEKRSTTRPAPLSDYSVPGIRSAGLSTALSGLFGTLVVFGAVLLLGRAMRKPGRREVKPTDTADEDRRTS